MAESSSAICESPQRKTKRFPRLCSKLSYIPLGSFPTPVHSLKELEKTLGVQNLYIKRDDLSSPFYGGNKVRKLEFYLAQALEHEHSRVLTLGAAGSNHIAAVGYYCARLGLQSSAICFPQPPSPYVQKNLLFNLRNQVTLSPITSQYLLPFALARIFGKAPLTPEKPYFIPMGGTSFLGIFSYVLAAFELIDQIESGEIPCPKRVYCALGSAGTATGLLLGFHLAGYPEIEVRPVSVVPKPFCGPQYVAFYANQCNRFLRKLDSSVPYISLKSREIHTIENQVGSGYGFFTSAGTEAQKAIQETEGILLEGTYTAKALAGLLATEKIDPAPGPVLFWNTINSVNLQMHLEGMDWRQLPKPLQFYFQ
ncbi:MAG: pyridoxal-phosphate dependent enzyme [Planctomycetota bacterium]